MFDPIVAPDVHRGPATGHSTEFGTTWHEAVTRINAAFKMIFEKGLTVDVNAEIAAIDDAMTKLRSFEARLAELGNVGLKLDAIEKRLGAIDNLDASLTVTVNSIVGRLSEMEAKYGKLVLVPAKGGHT
jgi:hypothetical protein